MNFRSINQLLRTDQEIDNMIAFINSGKTQYPPNVNQPAYLLKSNLFNIQNNNLFYTADNKQFVKKADAPQLIKDLYEDKQTGLGRSQKSFYYEIKERYYNITRNQVVDILNTSPIYLANRHKVAEKGYTTKIYSEPLECFVIDLIDFNKILKKNTIGQRKYRYMLTIMDVFSKYCWLKPLVEKSADAVKTNLEQIFSQPNSMPKRIWTDRGSELKNDDLKAYCDRNHIEQMYNRPYVPVKYIESFNRNVRKTLRELFLRNGNLKWYDKCDELSNILNNTLSQVTGKKPSELFLLRKPNEKINNVNKKVKERNEKKHLKNIETQFRVGDPVLLNLGDVQRDIMSIKKTNIDNYKNIVLRWSPEIYYVSKVLHKRNATGWTRYEIAETQNLNTFLRGEDGQKIQLKGTSLLDATNMEAHNIRHLEFMNGMRNLNLIKRPLKLVFA